MKNLTSNAKNYMEVKNRNEFDRKRILITGGAGKRGVKNSC
jgi:FlaA1/EpsC-like NDP-sugar epimerase